MSASATLTEDIQARVASARTVWIYRYLLALVMCALSLVYVLRTWPNVVWQDGFFIVDHLRALDESGWSISGAIPVFGEHLLPVWLGITWLNAKFLSLNMRLDPLVFVLAYAGHFLLLSRYICKEDRALSGPGAVVAVTALGGLCFSLVQPPMVLMSCQFALSTTFGLWGAIALSNAWQRDAGLRGLWPFVLLASLYFTMCGGYFPGFLFGIAGVVLWHKVVRGQRWTAVLSVAAVVLGLAMLYSASLALRKGAVSGGAGPMAAFARLLDIPATCNWLLTGIGASVIDIHTAEERLHPLLLPLMGGVLVTLAGILLWYHGRASSRRVPPVLLYCLLYPIGVILAVRAGRGDGNGALWVANDWYLCHWKFFAIGTFWLLWISITEPSPRILKVTSGTAAVLLAVVIAAANCWQWHRSPNIFAWMAEKQAAMVSEPSDLRARLLCWDRAGVDRGLEFLSTHHLSVFSKQTAPSAAERVTVTGWSGDGFIGQSATCRLSLVKPAHIVISAWCPPFIKKNTFSVKVNQPGFEPKVIELSAGETKTVALELPAGGHELSLRCAVSQCPAEIGLNSDVRPLSVVAKLSVMRACLAFPPADSD